MNKDIVLAQLSGLESVDVILKAMKREDINIIQPVISYSGIEVNNDKDPWQMYFYNALLSKAAEKFPDKQILEPINITHQNIWRILIGNTCNLQAGKFGFYSPCLGCKMYYHIIRIPMVLSTSNKVITVTEINPKKPYSEITQAYTQKLMDRFDIEWICDSAEVPKEKKHISCGFSGSLKSNMDSSVIERYYDEYLYPAAEAITEELIVNQKLTNDSLYKICRGRLL